MAKVEIYTKRWCPYSVRARELLDRKGVRYEEIDVTTDAVRELEMVLRSERHTVPQIFIDDHHVGGSDDLAAADASGELNRLLSGEPASGKDPSRKTTRGSDSSTRPRRSIRA